MTEVHYQGRKWDAPLTDDAIEVDYLVGKTCTVCEEPIVEGDDAILNTWANQPHHLECYLRGPLGSVAHLEGRCSCNENLGVLHNKTEYATYREDAKATLQWMIDHNRGRFHESPEPTG